MDEIGEGGNIENEVLVVLDNELTVNVVDIEGSIDVWVNVFVRDVKTGDFEGILKELGFRNSGGCGSSLSWLSKNRLCQR